jgi:translation initiation factor IF-2
VIYDLVDDVKAAASGLLSAEVRETFIGYAEIKQVFKVSNVGKVAGCSGHRRAWRAAPPGCACCATTW